MTSMQQHAANDCDYNYDYNLCFSSDVEAEDTREKIDITKHNAELKTTVAKIDLLCRGTDVIMTDIEGDEV